MFKRRIRCSLVMLIQNQNGSWQLLTVKQDPRSALVNPVRRRHIYLISLPPCDLGEGNTNVQVVVGQPNAPPEVQNREFTGDKTAEY